MLHDRGWRTVCHCDSTDLPRQKVDNILHELSHWLYEKCHSLDPPPLHRADRGLLQLQARRDDPRKRVPEPELALAVQPERVPAGSAAVRGDTMYV